jgi:hypothetical protein
MGGDGGRFAAWLQFLFVLAAGFGTFSILYLGSWIFVLGLFDLTGGVVNQPAPATFWLAAFLVMVGLPIGITVLSLRRVTASARFARSTQASFVFCAALATTYTLTTALLLVEALWAGL